MLAQPVVQSISLIHFKNQQAAPCFLVSSWQCPANLVGFMVIRIGGVSADKASAQIHVAGIDGCRPRAECENA